MSFFGGLVGAIKGAVVGFVTGGPAGAVVGAVGGAVSGSAGHSPSQGGLDYVQPTYIPRAQDMYLYQSGYGSPAAAGAAYQQPVYGPRPKRPRGRKAHCVCRPMARSHFARARMGAGRNTMPSIYTGPRNWRTR